MNKLQKELNKLSDKLSKNHEAMKPTPDPYDNYYLIQKGKKYDALKEKYDKLETRYNESYAARLKVDAQRDELLKVLKLTLKALLNLCKQIPNNENLADYNFSLCEVAQEEAEQLIKTCEND